VRRKLPVAPSIVQEAWRSAGGQIGLGLPLRVVPTAPAERRRPALFTLKKTSGGRLEVAPGD